MYSCKHDTLLFEYKPIRVDSTLLKMSSNISSLIFLQLQSDKITIIVTEYWYCQFDINLGKNAY